MASLQGGLHARARPGSPGSEGRPAGARRTAQGPLGQQQHPAPGSGIPKRRHPRYRSRLSRLCCAM
eukprot:10508816-Alexandrium_andersonii.AAC.1